MSAAKQEQLDEAMALIPALISRSASIAEVRRFRRTAMHLLGCRKISEIDSVPLDVWRTMLRTLTGTDSGEALDPALVITVRAAIRQPVLVARPEEEKEEADTGESSTA